MLIDFFRNWRLRLKLLVSFLSLLIIALTLSVILYFSYNHFIKLEHTLSKLENLKLKIKTEELNIKNLQYEIYKDESFHVGKQMSKNDLIESKNDLLASINDLFGKSNKIDSQLIEVKKDIIQISQLKLSLHENLLKRGFKETGFEGKLREAVHAVEQIDGFDKVLLLSLRRHEKDFMLRKDVKYVEDFNKKIALLEAEFPKTIMAGQPDISKNIKIYKQDFNALVEIEKIIGLNEDSGLRKEIKTIILKLNNSISQIESDIKTQIEEEKENINTVLLLTSILIVFISILLSIQFSNLITKIIKEIRNGMKEFAAGRLPAKLNVLTTEEIGQTKVAFNQLIDRIEAAQTFATKIGNGKFNDSYRSEFEDDLLAQALVKASKELQIADTIRKDNDYINQGIAKLSEIVSNKDETLEQLSYRLLLVFIQYFEANQGVLYSRVFTKQEDWQMIPTSFYAYGKKKAISNSEILPPLVEQTLNERELVYLEEIPDNYIKVTSGLGEALPSSIVLVPLLYRNNSIGIIELAFFYKLTKLQLSLLQKLSIQAAAILESKTSETESSIKNNQVKAAIEHAITIEENLRKELEQALYENEKLKESIQFANFR